VNHSANAEVGQPDTGKTLKLDHSVKSTRPVSAYRDAHFLRDLEDLCAAPVSAPLAASSVMYTPTPPSTSLSPSSPHRPPNSERRRYSRYGLWHREQYAGRPARAYRSPAKWRDTSPELRVWYLHKALATLGTVYSFTLNLSPEIETDARKQSNPENWLHRRIARQLKRQFGREVPFLAVVEEDEGRLHVHGEFLIEKHESKRARKALRCAGGEWVQNRQHQAKTRHAPDLGWASYIVKDFWKYGRFRPWLRDSRVFGKTTITGSLFSATADVKRLAVELYEEDWIRVYRARYGRA